MRIALFWCLCLGCTSTKVREPATPQPSTPATADAEPVEEVASEVGRVERADEIVKLSGMIVNTHPRDERTVTALGVSIAAAPGAGWLDVRVTTETSDDAGLDYLHCHDLQLRADTSFGEASKKEADSWWLPLQPRHEADANGEAVTAKAWRGWVEHLAKAGVSGGKICEDEFTLAASQKAKLRELLAELGPADAGWSEGNPPSVISPPPWGLVGVATCDEYLTKYHRCIQEHAPEAARQPMLDAMKQTAEAWREAARGPAGEGLDTACRAALDAVKQATSSMGCEW
jgi:hypothetical protein